MRRRTASLNMSLSVKNLRRDVKRRAMREIQVYRIAQEALNNICRHAGPDM